MFKGCMELVMFLRVVVSLLFSYTHDVVRAKTLIFI